MTSKKILIIQTSPFHTGSTVLVNLLYGFICKDDPILVYWNNDSNDLHKLNKSKYSQKSYFGYRQFD